MLDGLLHLVELQRLDGEIIRREESLAAIPEQRKRLGESREFAAARLAEASESLQTAEMSQRQAEAGLQDQEALLSRLEGQQFQVKDNAAYTALLHEMEHAKQQISECETAILEGMDAVETAGETLSAAETGDRETRDRVEADEKALVVREEKLGRELNELGEQRDQVGPKLDRAILSLYERIAKRRRPAVTLVTDEMCAGCRVGIPAQNYIEILKGERLITCGSCQRILLHPDMVSPARAS